MATRAGVQVFFDKKEHMSSAERQGYYNENLARMIRLGNRQSGRVRKIFAERGIRPSEVKSVKDLEKLPVISREELVKLQIEEPPFAGLSGKDMMTDRIFTSPGPVYE